MFCVFLAPSWSFDGVWTQWTLVRRSTWHTWLHSAWREAKSTRSCEWWRLRSNTLGISSVAWQGIGFYDDSRPSTFADNVRNRVCWNYHARRGCWLRALYRILYTPHWIYKACDVLPFRRQLHCKSCLPLKGLLQINHWFQRPKTVYFNSSLKFPKLR